MLEKTAIKSERKEDELPSFDFFNSIAPDCENRAILMDIATNVMQNQIDARKFITLKSQCSQIQI